MARFGRAQPVPRRAYRATALSEALTDTGAGAEALSLASAVPLTVTGTGADALTAAAAIPLGDSGSGAESSFTVAVAVALAESGTVAESFTPAAAVPLAKTIAPHTPPWLLTMVRLHLIISAARRAAKSVAWGPRRLVLP